MPLFQLVDELIFPHPLRADDDGLLAIGGDLSVERLLLAYSNGIFPWFSNGSPILWWFTHPRMVLFPDKMKISASLKQTINSKKFTVTFDQCFREVIGNCAKAPRHGENGTWITPEMKKAYTKLHLEGYAHSVETWFEGELAGGLYGVSLGRVFYGESMFFKVRDASKVALYYLVQFLKSLDFMVIDAQQDTPHLRKLGAELVQGREFLKILERSAKFPTLKGSWNNENETFTKIIKI